MKLRLTLVLACVAVAAPARAQSDDLAKASVGYLKSLQSKSGGFLPAEAPKGKPLAPTLRATSSAVRAFKYFGAELPNKDAVAKFVASCFDKATGGFTDQPGQGQPDVFTTAVGLMAAAELGLPADPYHAAAQKYLADHVKNFEEVRIAVAGLERINAKAANPEAWRKVVAAADEELDKAETKPARDLASVLVTYLRLGHTLPKAVGYVKVLQQGQMPSGGYGKAKAETADLETSYRVMRAFMMLKGAPKDVEGMRSFVAKCRNEDHGYGLAPGEPSTVGATYFASIILHWLDAAEKKK